MIANKEARLCKLVELYGTYKAYDEVSRTCKLYGFDAMLDSRRRVFDKSLRQYSRDYYGSDDKRSLARSMDDVIHARNQLTLF